MGRSEVYDLLAARQLASLKMGNCRRIPAEALRAYLAGLAELAP